MCFVSVGIKDETGFDRLELILIDLANFASVTAFVDTFVESNGRLDILVANAAIASNEYKLTTDGWEEQ